MNEIINKRLAEFDKLAGESFARGGFLTTDYAPDGNNRWELDASTVRTFLESSIKEAYEAGREDEKLFQLGIDRRAIICDHGCHTAESSDEEMKKNGCDYCEFNH